MAAPRDGGVPPRRPASAAAMVGRVRPSSAVTLSSASGRTGGRRPASAVDRRRGTQTSTAPQADAARVAARTSFFSLAELVPSVLEAPTTVNVTGRALEDASYDQLVSPGLEHGVSRPIRAARHHHRDGRSSPQQQHQSSGAAAGAAGRGSSRSRSPSPDDPLSFHPDDDDEHEDFHERVTEDHERANSRRPAARRDGSPSSSGTLRSMPGFVGAATVVRASSALDALLEYADKTSDARIVAAASSIRQRRAEGQKRREGTLIRAAVPQSTCVTERLTQGATAQVLPSASGTAGAAALYDRLGVAYVASSGENPHSPESTPSAARTSQQQHKQQPRSKRRPIEARLVQHQREKWGLYSEERQFFVPSLRRPSSGAVERRRRELRESVTVKPDCNPLLLPVKSGPTAAPQVARPASAHLSRHAAGRPVSAASSSAAVLGLSAVGADVTGRAHSRLSVREAQREAARLLATAETTLRQEEGEESVR